MVEFTLPANSKIGKGKTWPAMVSTVTVAGSPMRGAGQAVRPRLVESTVVEPVLAP